MESYKKIREISNWIKTIERCVNTNIETMKTNLLNECKLVREARDRDSEFLKSLRPIKFPSKETKDIANNILKFTSEEFYLYEIITFVELKKDSIKDDCYYDIIIMLRDIALYNMYSIINGESQGDFLSQLNECIVLDAMKIKPDDITDFSLELKEVSDKAKLNIDLFNISTVWAIAMLNYKTHVYDTAIYFFNMYLDRCKEEQSYEITIKKLHAQIYIGYCCEKNNEESTTTVIDSEKESEKSGFDKAINIFEDLIQKIKNKENYSELKDEERKELCIELHHGLGHFYNERAVFGRNSDSESSDLQMARHHMKLALEQKDDYYSCYGSLYHEYGDYESADRIFEDASENETIKSNQELSKEMEFYIGYTKSALLINGGDKDKNDKEDNFGKFETYCQKTFNYDGIVHARVFKIRAMLKNIILSQSYYEKKLRQADSVNLNKWYNELTSRSLSSYASASIKKEYQKTLYMLRIFQSFYRGDNFIWHMEDIQYDLYNFIELMPKYSCELEISFDNSKKEIEQSITTSNLYCMKLGKIWVWCVSGKQLQDYIKEKNIYFDDISDDNCSRVQLCPVYGEQDKMKAHDCILGNGKHDLVVVIPPETNDTDFEKEVEAIMKDPNESYVVFTSETNNYYDKYWLRSKSKSTTDYYYEADTVGELLKIAYCFRAYEILRKELRNPIPLFSLAPTHFSSSYDFQLGEAIPIQTQFMEKKINTGIHKKIRKQLQYIETKYPSKTYERLSVKDAKELIDKKYLDCINEGLFVACFPFPKDNIWEDNYISYRVQNKSSILDGKFPHKIENNQIYTVKALPSYKEKYKELCSLFENECDHVNNGECACHCEILLAEENNVSQSCRDLLVMIFGDYTNELKYSFKCILRKFEESGKKECIYMVLLLNSINKEDELIMSEEKKTTVFVTYAWEPENGEFSMYQKEVLDFTNKLRADGGYDAQFDLSLAEHDSNWIDIMLKGLQYDKIIVLLSPEYKRKADKTNGTGVSKELKVIVGLLEKKKGNVILAKLLSQKDKERDEILPLMYNGEDVIDLSSDQLTNGYNKLYARLNDENIVELSPIGNVKKEIKKL